MSNIASIIIGSLFVSSLAFANHHEGMPEPSKEQRAKMAEMHTKMAECLKSDKPMKDCHKEMMESCKSSGDACPMMGKHGGHMGMDKMKKGEDGK